MCLSVSVLTQKGISNLHLCHLWNPGEMSRISDDGQNVWRFDIADTCETPIVDSVHKLHKVNTVSWHNFYPGSLQPHGPQCPWTFRHNELAYRKSPNENPERSKPVVLMLPCKTNATKRFSVQGINLTMLKYNHTMCHWFVVNRWTRK